LYHDSPYLGTAFVEDSNVYANGLYGATSQKNTVTKVSHASPEPEADPDMDVDAEGEPDLEIQADGKPYAFRQRSKVSYVQPTPLEEMREPPPRKNQSNGRAGGRKHGRKGPGWNTTGAELGRWMGDDSVCSPFIDFFHF
jgi:hypothetical protein